MTQAESDARLAAAPGTGPIFSKESNPAVNNDETNRNIAQWAR